MVRGILAALTGFALSIGTAAAQSCTGLPYTFSSGATISAAQMNANFAYITTCFATLGANTFTGAQTLPANPTSALQAATKQYVDGAGSGGGGAGFVNRFRNATFVSWPNGASGSVPTSGSASTLIAANGWACRATTAAGAWSQQTTGQNGNYYALRIAGAASNGGLTCSQRIGGADAAVLAGKQVTVQVTIKNVTGAALNVQVSTCYASAFENFTSCTGDQSAVDMSASPCAANATCTFAYSFQTATTSNTVTNGYGITFSFGTITSASNYVEMSAPDIRVTPGASTGPVTSPPAPELRDLQSELARNAAYFQASYINGTTPGTPTRAGIRGGGTYNLASGASIAPGEVMFPTPMRAQPTLNYWDGNGNASKISYIATGGTTWVDNIAAFAAPFNISAMGFLYSGENVVPNAASFIHYAAYADFW